MDDNARVLTEWFGRTVIKSNRRFSYGEAQNIIDTAKGDLKDEILKLNELAILLRKRRFGQGSISFERDEVKIDVDSKGKPIRIYYRDHGASHELIEEFMLQANRCVATL
jgi:ribonuclease R